MSSSTAPPEFPSKCAVNWNLPPLCLARAAPILVCDNDSDTTPTPPPLPPPTKTSTPSPPSRSPSTIYLYIPSPPVCMMYVEMTSLTPKQTTRQPRQLHLDQSDGRPWQCLAVQTYEGRGIKRERVAGWSGGRTTTGEELIGRGNTEKTNTEEFSTHRYAYIWISQIWRNNGQLRQQRHGQIDVYKVPTYPSSPPLPNKQPPPQWAAPKPPRSPTFTPPSKNPGATAGLLSSSPSSKRNVPSTTPPSPHPT